MQWSDIQRAYPDEWLIIEALEAETTPDHQRHLNRIAVVERCPNSTAALQSYQRLHRAYPLRELYYVHTSRPTLDIRERRWVGIRSSSAIHA